MRTYNELFRSPEFTRFFLVFIGQRAAQTISGPALGGLVYIRTGSPLLAALAMFGPSLAQMIGAMTLLAAADRLAPRAALVCSALVFAAGTAAQAAPGAAIWAIFIVLFGLGVTASLSSGVMYGLLNELVDRDGYLIGRSVLNISVGVTQILGFTVGAILTASLSPSETLLIGASLYLVTAIIARFGLRFRPPRSAGRAVIIDTFRINVRLWSSGPRRCVYLALWVPNGLIVGCQALYISYAPGSAGVLYACAAAGMLAGDVLAGRFIPRRWRERLGAPLRLLLAAPYAVFALHPSLLLAAGTVAVASVGFASSLLLQERLMSLTPHELSGQALGLHSSGMLTMQGVGAGIAGGIAELTSPAVAMSLMAAASTAVTLILARGLRPPADSTGSPTERSPGEPHVRRPLRAAGRGRALSPVADIDKP